MKFNPRKFFSEGRWATTLAVVIALAFSLWLMCHTFSYDPTIPAIRICNLIWSDNLSHIPLIRSFSRGSNWPPEYPLFPGEPIRYHFVFYAFVGLLERIGLRLDWAFNGLAALSFSSLALVVYGYGAWLYRDRRVGWLAMIFLVLNGSLSFGNFFPSHAIADFWTVNQYPSFGPWDGSEISAFWNLNIFINQRHLGFALAYILATGFAAQWIQKRARREQLIVGAVMGLVAGLFPLYHQPALMMIGILVGIYLLLLPSARPYLIAYSVATVVLVALQFPFVMASGGKAAAKIGFQPGYLMNPPISIGHFLTYWAKNVGLHLVLIPIGIALSPRAARIAYVPAGIIFLLAFLVRFGTDASLNHKYFNYCLIIAQIASAYALTRFVDLAPYSFRLFRCLRATETTSEVAPLRALGWLVPAGIVVSALFSFVLLTFSGVVDLMVVKNSYFYNVNDIPTDDVAEWIAKNTSPRAIFLNSNYGFNSASLAGRPILMGWPYFAGGIGYDTATRTDLAKKVFEGGDPASFCPPLKTLRASYLMIEHSTDANFPPINDVYFREHFKPVYTAKDGHAMVFDVATLCPY